MAWELEEAMAYYRREGAPRDQQALTNLLKEVKSEQGGSIPSWCVEAIAREYAVKPALLLALIRRFPSLRLNENHLLQLCAGPNCGKAAKLAEYAEAIAKESGGKIRLQFVPCMRLCGKGPNLKWDGQLHHKADETLLESLTGIKL